PAFAAETANPAFGGGERQRNEQHETGESHGDEAALGNIRQHFVDVEELIQPNIGEKMQRRVEKSEQPEHAAIANQPELTSQLAHWSDCKRYQEEDQNPISRGVSDDFDGIGA